MGRQGLNPIIRLCVGRPVVNPITQPRTTSVRRRKGKICRPVIAYLHYVAFTIGVVKVWVEIPYVFGSKGSRRRRQGGGP